MQGLDGLTMSTMVTEGRNDNTVQVFIYLLCPIKGSGSEVKEYFGYSWEVEF
jgi:hypothetical protein